MIGAVDSAKAFLVHMRVYLRSGDRSVAEHLLYGADIRSMRKEARGEAVPQDVWRYSCRVYACGDRALLQELEYAHSRESLAEARHEKMPLGEIGAH